MPRESFRQDCCERDDATCVIPWCGEEVTPNPDGPGEQHHIIERELWPDGGYISENGASVCNEHHRHAEANHIPPQAFWYWIGLEGVTPDGMPKDVNKWGEEFETPPWGELREFHKYPSTRHLLPLYWQSDRETAKARIGDDDTGLTSLETFLGIPLVCTGKMDGSNTLLVKDTDEPVRARNATQADHLSFDMLKKLYWDHNVYSKLPENLQVFGEWLYACHSIHYGCDGCHEDRNHGPPLEDYFQVFGVFDTEYNIWLSWDETKEWADELGFSTPPVFFENETFENEQELLDLVELGHDVVDQGHEGFVLRSRFPFHYGQFGQYLGKYVRPDHVNTDEHWRHQNNTQNVLR